MNEKETKADEEAEAFIEEDSYGKKVIALENQTANDLTAAKLKTAEIASKYRGGGSQGTIRPRGRP